jgi:hypothetical protein
MFTKREVDHVGCVIGSFTNPHSVVVPSSDAGHVREQ